jgi:aspartyl/asparaginyl beta-hydroxylase (cupin superfamily)
MDNDPQSLIAQGLAALNARDMPRAAALLREAVAGALPGEMPWAALANAEMALGHNDAAEAAIERQLEREPRDIGALLVKGLLRERGSDARAASSFYRTALNQAAVNGAVPPSLAALHAHAQAFLGSSSGAFEAHLLEALGGDLSPAMTEAVELLTGKREIDLQQPKVFYYPGLPQRRFFEVGEFPWFEAMLALVPAMQDELAAVLAAGAEGFAPYVERQPNRPAPNNPLLGKQDWSALHFWRNGGIVEDNAVRCPATMQALGEAPMPWIPGRSPNAHWSRLLPGAHIAPHFGMLNTRLICHIPILTAPDCSLRVGSESRGWVDGVPLIFDDSIEHEARNPSAQPRVILLFEIWRPEIPEEDRAAISRIFQAIGEYGA